MPSPAFEKEIARLVKQLGDDDYGKREAASKRLPPERQAVMHRANEDLRASGILDRVIKVGDPLPAFSLQTKFPSINDLPRIFILARCPFLLTNWLPRLRQCSVANCRMPRANQPFAQPPR